MAFWITFWIGLIAVAYVEQVLFYPPCFYHAPGPCLSGNVPLILLGIGELVGAYVVSVVIRGVWSRLRRP